MTVSAPTALQRLFSPLQFLKGIGPRRAESLAAHGLTTIFDLLHWLPRKHYDRRQIRRIKDVRVGEVETIQGVVMSTGVEQTSRRHMTVFRMTVGDESGTIEAVWFQQRYLSSTFAVGDVVILCGKVDMFRTPQIKPEEYEIIGGEGYEPIHTSGLVPAYPTVEGMGRKGLRRLIHDAVTEFGVSLPDGIPPDVRQKRGLMGAGESIRAIHFPKDEEEREQARRRLAYEEFFFLELTLALKRLGVRQHPVKLKLKMTDQLESRIRLRFPFELTKAQDRVLKELRADLRSDRPMNRLLQGDVGSGKTVVAAYSVLAAIGNHHQAVILAPTEILAEQHLRTFERFLKGSKVRIGFVAGGRQTKAGAEVKRQIAAGEIDLVIGTHAILEEDVKFKALAVVVIDEQQKFGVLQRASMRMKGERPHILVMTATPIPRTLALTLFGDLDVSVIDEMPPGRKPVTTLLRRASKREEELAFVRKLLREGRQAYFVSPLVEESQKLQLESATKLFEKLRRELDPFKVALLHGRMKSEEKDAVMEEFRRGGSKALVSTLVIEVGIDVPNATVMVIENAERFGLSQLHQLRGRIGRGTEEGYCILFGEARTEEAEERLRAFVETSDGFKIAEADLRIRGPGEFLGTRQSGLPEFRAANIITDAQLLGWAKDDAFALVETDPHLARNGMLKTLVAQRSATAPLVTVG